MQNECLPVIHLNILKLFFYAVLSSGYMSLLLTHSVKLIDVHLCSQTKTKPQGTDEEGKFVLIQTGVGSSMHTKGSKEQRFEYLSIGVHLICPDNLTQLWYFVYAPLNNTQSC